jgi:hypothetical protein
MLHTAMKARTHTSPSPSPPPKTKPKRWVWIVVYHIFEVLLLRARVRLAAPSRCPPCLTVHDTSCSDPWRAIHRPAAAAVVMALLLLVIPAAAVVVVVDASLPAR